MSEKLWDALKGARRAEITGVVIVARGMENMKTRINVQNAVQILLNVELSRIEIIERK